MKTSQVFSAMIGAALLGGVAMAQQDGPQGFCPRGEGPGFRPEWQARMKGRPDQPGGPRMMQQRRPEGMGAAQMRRGGPGGEGGQDRLPDPKRLKEAGATEQQLEALKKFVEEQQVKRIDLKAAAEKSELAFEQLMRSEDVDEKAAFKAADALSQSRAELFKLGISARLKAKEILGAEVVKKLREMGPPEGVGRPGRGPRPDGPSRQDAPPACGRPPLPEQK